MAEAIEDILERIALTLTLWDEGAAVRLLGEIQAIEDLKLSQSELISPILERMKELGNKTMHAQAPVLLEQGLSLIRDVVAGVDRKHEIDEFLKTQPVHPFIEEMTLESSEFERLPNLYFDYLNESRMALDNMRKTLDAMKDEGDLLGNLALLVREFHKLHGLSELVDYQVLAKIAGAAKSALEKVRDGEWPYGIGLIKMLRKVVHLFEEAIESLSGDWEAGADIIWDKSASEMIEGLSNGIFELPVNRSRLGEILVEKGLATPSQITAALQRQKEAPDRRLGEILVQEKVVTNEQISTALVDQKQTVPQRETETATFIRINTEKLDLLLDTVGEIVIAQSLAALDEHITAIRDEQTLNKLAMLNRNIFTLQRIAMNLRMVPIQQVFQKLGRISRDIAHKHGKEIRIVFEGEKTEIDRNVAEFIYDPLVHMVRNAADHGIEDPAARKAAGKPEMGTIRIGAECRQGQVIIAISDDGKGLDKERILSKALEKKLVPQDQSLSDSQIYQLIFAAGLSTAAKVTEISGRGVGMDVVKTNIEKLHGKIKVDTVLGQGTTFTIVLPLTMAIIDGMVVRVGHQRYVLPLTGVQEILRPASEQCFRIQNRGEVVKLRDRLYPIIRLHERFQVSGAAAVPSNGLLIIVEDDQMRAAILVDELVGKQQVVVKSLGEGFKGLRGVSGAAILGQGNLGLILDLASIIGQEAVV